MTAYKEFETSRLHIRPTREQDADLIYRMMNAPKFIQYVGDRKIHSIAESVQYIKEKMIPQLIELGYSNYSLINKESGVKVGVCGLYNRTGIEGIDIGFGILPEYERMGFAFKSAQRLIQAAFNQFDIAIIKAITSKENVASQKLLQKLGLSRAGEMQLPNEREALFLYEKIRQ